MTTTILVIESVVLVLLTVLVAGLLRSHAEILRRLHSLGAGLDPDAPSPELASMPVELRARVSGSFATAADLDGAGLRDDALHVPVVGTRHRTLLAFLSSGCLTCQTFWTAFADPARPRSPRRHPARRRHQGRVRGERVGAAQARGRRTSRS